MSSDSESENNQSDGNSDEEVDDTEVTNGSKKVNGKNSNDTVEEVNDDKDVTWSDLVRNLLFYEKWILENLFYFLYVDFRVWSSHCAKQLLN